MIEVGRGVSRAYAVGICAEALSRGIRATYSAGEPDRTTSLWVLKKDADAFYRLRIGIFLGTVERRPERSRRILSQEITS